MNNKKPIDFATFKKIQKMSLNTFNRWLADLCSTIYDDGATSILDDCQAVLTEDRLMEILLSVKGIGEKRAKEAATKILQEGIGYYGHEIGRNNEECE